jgi:hypothetical protein
MHTAHLQTFPSLTQCTTLRNQAIFKITRFQAHARGLEKGERFSRADKIWNGSPYHVPAAEHQGVQEAEGWLQQCDIIVDRLALFSSNEEVDDIATADLKYLLVSGQYADLQSRTAGQDIKLRRQGLLQAIESYAR